MPFIPNFLNSDQAMELFNTKIYDQYGTLYTPNPSSFPMAHEIHMRITDEAKRILRSDFHSKKPFHILFSLNRRYYGDCEDIQRGYNGHRASSSLDKKIAIKLIRGCSKALKEHRGSNRFSRMGTSASYTNIIKFAKTAGISKTEIETKCLDFKNNSDNDLLVSYMVNPTFGGCIGRPGHAMIAILEKKEYSHSTLWSVLHVWGLLQDEHNRWIICEEEICPNHNRKTIKMYNYSINDRILSKIEETMDNLINNTTEIPFSSFDNCHGFAVYALSLCGVFDQRLSDAFLPLKNKDIPNVILTKDRSAWVIKDEAIQIEEDPWIQLPKSYEKILLSKMSRSKSIEQITSDIILAMFQDYTSKKIRHPNRHHRELASNFITKRQTIADINDEVFNYFIDTPMRYRSAWGGGSFYRRLAFINTLSWRIPQLKSQLYGINHEYRERRDENKIYTYNSRI
ncbi:MAG: hypothetical protein GY710_19930 [Desulfobacteraceae bacterium]|nr:hypothetical protein [Desulfobacteraceae bacterium]